MASIVNPGTSNDANLGIDSTDLAENRQHRIGIRTAVPEQSEIPRRTERIDKP